MSNSSDTLYTELKTFFDNTLSGNLNMTNVLALVHQGMKLVQTGKKWKKLSGEAKKELVLNAIEKLVGDLLKDPQVGGKLSSKEKEAVQIGLDLAPYIIDATVDFSKYISSHRGSCKKFSCVKK